MPELPDITVYTERLGALFGGQKLLSLRVQSPFVLRTFDPPVAEFVGRRLLGTGQLGKRVVLKFEGDFCAVIHLMVAGRFHLKEQGKEVSRKWALLSFDFETASVMLTEAGTKKRASLHLFRTEAETEALSRGGLSPFQLTRDEFASVLVRENRTLKRALCDPSLLSGIGNAYSDEILFWAEQSPVKRTQSLTPDEFDRLYVSTRHTLAAWTRKLRRECAGGFPETVTAFRPEMAVHGRYQLPCPICQTAVQRIVYAQNETNYCPRCQTGGKVLADRALSRLLRGDWPTKIEDLEEI